MDLPAAKLPHKNINFVEVIMPSTDLPSKLRNYRPGKWPAKPNRSY
jgi:hypothetical protein